MAINLPPLNNGLQQVNTGLIPGDGLGDQYYVAWNKFNENFAITLTQNDDLAGAGLSWNKGLRKFSLEVAPNHILVGTSTLPLNNTEFVTNGQSFTIGRIHSSKITGTFSSGQLQIPFNTFLVGNANGMARSVSFSNEFRITNNVLEVNSIDFNKIENVVIDGEKLSLSSRHIFVGNENGKASPIFLSSDFSIVGNTLRVSVVPSINNGNNTPPSAEPILIGLAQINAGNRAPHRVLSINPTNTGMVWAEIAVPESQKEEVLSLSAYLQHIVSKQRSANSKTKRSIAQLQNQMEGVEVYNSELPMHFRAILTQSQIPANVNLNNIYVLGGVNQAAFNLNCEKFIPATETVREISAVLTQRKPESYSINATDTFGYILGGTHTGNNVERFTYATERFNTISANLAVPRHGAVTVSSTTQGFVIGGHNASANPAFVRTIQRLTFANDTFANSSLSLVTDDSAYRAVSSQTTTAGYIFGGRTATATITRTLLLNITNETLTTLFNNLGVAVQVRDNRFGAASCRSATKAYIVGGALDFEKRSNRVSVFNFASQALTLMANLLNTSHSSQAGGQTTVKGYIFGGLETYLYTMPVSVNLADSFNIRNVLRKE